MALDVNRTISNIQTPGQSVAQSAATAPIKLPKQDNTAAAVKPEPTGQILGSQDSASEQEQVGNEQIGNEQIRKAVEHLTKNMSNSEAVFGIHEGTNRVTIKIIDKSTHEVIKELPPEKTLDMIARVWEMAGILVDEKR